MAGIPIENLNLSARATNVLHRMNVHEVEQLLNTSMEQIAEQRNIGSKTIAEIRSAVKQIAENDVGIGTLGKAMPILTDDNHSEKTFSEEQLEELSYHCTTELKLSNRAKNALMKINCETMDALAKMSEADIRNIKGLGEKTCNEILQERDRWFEVNDFILNDNIQNEEIPEGEQNFYQELARKIKPVVSIYWKKLRDIALKNESITNLTLEFVDDKCIRQVMAFEELDVHIKNMFLKYAPNGIIKTTELERQLSLLDLEFDSSILMDKISDGAICIMENGYCLLNRPHAMQYLHERYAESNERNEEIILKRLSGANLQMIGDKYGLTRERVRQILVQTARKMPLMYEDYFSEPYEYFKLTKEEFCNAFPSCGETGYEYLFIKYKKGDMEITPDNLENYTGRFSQRMNIFWSEESIRKDKQMVSKTEMVYRVLLSNGDKSMSMEEFEKEYYAYIERRNYPLERLMINQRTVTNHLRNAKHIVFDKNNCVRYCEADSKVIWERIDFTQYKDFVISTELIYRNYTDLMEELDIRDGYELFYVIKSSMENWDTALFTMNCRRVPVIVMGKGSEEAQAIQLLKEISPVDFQDYYEAYEERFGVRKESAQGNPTITGALANYYTEGMYAIDVPAIDEKDVVAFKEVLAIKNFWFTDELEREFQRVCVNSSADAFNSAAFKRIGYSLNMGYAYNDIYSSVVSYFDAEVFSDDIVNLNELDRRLVNLSAFNSAVYKKKMDLEYIEVAPKILMSISQVEYKYGITLSDVKRLQEWVVACEDKYYNAHSLWNTLSELDCAEKLQNNEWMCNCIFRQQDGIASLQVSGGMILCREYSELNFGLICKWLVEKHGSMTIQNLTSLFNDTFSTKIPVTKIAEKMKAYGLWEKFVTDSFDEYIDNLVIGTGAEMDDDDLFQEEFF